MNRRLPVWIWDRILTGSPALCRICRQRKWADGPWHICPNCDRNPVSPTPPNYR